MDEQAQAILLLEDGTIFHGKALGISGKATGEIVFNTGMAGYQEVFTDPSNFGQILVMSTSHIGNYGVTSSDSEIEEIQCAGIVVKDFSEVTSRKIADSSLLELMLNSNRLGISNIDTRALVRHIRSKGSMNAIISTEKDASVEDLKNELSKIPSMKGLELASKVTIKQPVTFSPETDEAKYKVAVIDFGSMRGIVKHLLSLSCEVRVFPMNTSFETIKAYEPNGIVLSAGPGDPSVMDSSIEVVKDIVASGIPTFGINLGHQLIALSQGVKTEKMLHGHRGVNHPVVNHRTGSAEVTSQNHGFVVNKESAEGNEMIEITHSHMNDHTVAGIALKNKPVFSVQYHPEPSVGPHDSLYLFDQFMDFMK